MNEAKTRNPIIEKLRTELFSFWIAVETGNELFSGKAQEMTQGISTGLRERVSRAVLWRTWQKKWLKRRGMGENGPYKLRHSSNFFKIELS